MTTTRPIIRAARAVPAAALALFAANACVPDLDAPEGAQIRCSSDDECPSNWVCNTDIHLCQQTLTEFILPEPQVVYVTPPAGADDVSVQAAVVLIFSMPVVDASLEDRVHLRTGGADVLFTRARIDVGAAYELVPDDPLIPATAYEVVVDAGVEGEPELSTPAESGFQSAFSTLALGDISAPQPVADLVVDVRGPGDTEISWTNPADADLAGVLILRSTDEAAVTALVNGRPYAIGAFSDSAQVVQTADPSATSWVDETVAGGAAFDYVVFAYDTTLNYSDPRSAPLITSVATTSCALSGDVTAAGPETATYHVELTDPAGTAPVVTHPATATVAVGDLVDLGPAGLVPGTQYDARVRASNADGLRIETPVPFWWLPATLDPLTAPVPIAAGGTAELLFSEYGWTSFEAEVDTDSLPASVTYGPANASPGIAASTISEAGQFQFRVRPTDAGCPTADWTESAPFNVEGVVYTSPGGDDNNDGVDPGDAVATFNRANDRVAELQSIADGAGLPRGVEVRVAVGLFSEILEIEADTRYLGGFEPTEFRVRYDPRDPANQTADLVTRIHPVATRAVEDGFSTPNAGTVVDGFDVKPLDTSISLFGFDVSGSLTATNNVVHGGEDAGASVTTAIDVSFSGTDRVANIHGNVITSGAGGTNSFGIRVNQTGDATITGNTIAAATVGINVAGIDSAIVQGNTVNMSEAVTASVSERVGIRMLTVDGEVSGNTVIGNDAFNDTSIGIQLGPFNSGNPLVRAERNVIYAGGGVSGVASIGIEINSTPDAVIVNNVIHGGTALESYAVSLSSSNSDVRIVNNTLYAGTGTNSAAGVQLFGSDHAAVVTNNLMFGAGGWFAIVQEQASAHPESFQDNVLIGTGGNAPAGVYRDNSGGSPVDYDASGAESFLCGLGGPAPTVNNVWIDVATAAVFASAAGGDGDLTTMSDNDWHLATSDTNITEAGRDTSIVNCGRHDTACPGTNTLDCGDVSEDIDGETRTVPFSVGADEP